MFSFPSLASGHRVILLATSIRSRRRLGAAGALTHKPVNASRLADSAMLLASASSVERCYLISFPSNNTFALTSLPTVID